MLLVDAIEMVLKLARASRIEPTESEREAMDVLEETRVRYHIGEQSTHHACIVCHEPMLISHGWNCKSYHGPMHPRCLPKHRC